MIQNQHASNHGGEQGDAGPGPGETAQYLAEILPELSTLAEGAGLSVTARVLRIATQDVKEHLARLQKSQYD